MMPKLSDFKALLFDVDTTLTTSKRVVPDGVEEALQKLAAVQTASGEKLKLAVCTGRPYISLRQRVLKLFPDDALHITGGGSQLITSTGEVLWEKTIAPEVTHQIQQRAEESHECYYIPGKEFGYGSKSFIEIYTNLHPLVPPLVSVNQLADDSPDWAAPTFPVVDVSPGFLEFLFKLHDEGKISLKKTRSYYEKVVGDITPPGVNKAVCLEEWCKREKIKPEEIIGFGDSDNDIEFLEKVGFAVAMGNATDAIMNIADRVIGRVDENGLAIYLDAVLKGNPL